MARDPVAAPAARPSNPRRISGANPGVLDFTQPARLLRFPGARLNFAAFDPRVATVQDIPDIPDLRKLSISEELYKPKRVVVETLPTGESHWRFVPSARKEEGVFNEGQWPRVIDICGELVECTQDQWDIYKLDPLYECCIHKAPALSTISRITRAENPAPPSPGGKRPISSAFSPSETSLPHSGQRKKVHLLDLNSEDEGSSEDDEVEEVEDMIVDDDVPRPTRRSAGPPGRKYIFKNKKLKNRHDRREKTAHRAEHLSRHDQLFDFTPDPSTSSQSVPPEPSAKRKVHSLFSSLRQDDHDYAYPDQNEHLRNTVNYAPSRPSKRTRTLSPTSAKRDLDAKRLEREKQKRERREEEQKARKEARERRFLSEILADIPNMQAFGENVDVSMGEGSDHDHEPLKNHYTEAKNIDPEEAARIVAIEESRRKMAELERDRPLWEEQARKRVMEEKAEEDASTAKVEARKRAEAMKAETERSAKSRQEQKESRQQDEVREREREEAARREKEKRQRQQSWSHGRWNSQRALERYRFLCDTFDTTKFSETVRLTIDEVPWPTLHSPSTFSIEDVDWKSVEKFFEDVKPHMRSQDYKLFIQSSHRRFHPDRWRSRSLLKSVADEAERGCIEVAANTVAQALTPLWAHLTGR